MPIPGANDASLTLTNVQPSFAASYTVTVTNVAGVINSQAASRWGATPAILESGQAVGNYPDGARSRHR